MNGKSNVIQSYEYIIKYEQGNALLATLQRGQINFSLKVPGGVRHNTSDISQMTRWCHA